MSKRPEDCLVCQYLTASEAKPAVHTLPAVHLNPLPSGKSFVDALAAGDFAVGLGDAVWDGVGFGEGMWGADFDFGYGGYLGGGAGAAVPFLFSPGGGVADVTFAGWDLQDALQGFAEAGVSPVSIDPRAVGVVAKTFMYNFKANIDAVADQFRAFMFKLNGVSPWAVSRQVVATHPLMGAGASAAERYAFASGPSSALPIGLLGVGVLALWLAFR